MSEDFTEKQLDEIAERLAEEALAELTDEEEDTIIAEIVQEVLAEENVDAVAGNEEVAQQIHNKDDVDSFGQQNVDPEPGLRVSDEPLGIKEPQKRLNIKPLSGIKWKR